MRYNLNGFCPAVHESGTTIVTDILTTQIQVKFEIFRIVWWSGWDKNDFVSQRHYVYIFGDIWGFLYLTIYGPNVPHLRVGEKRPKLPSPWRTSMGGRRDIGSEIDHFGTTALKLKPFIFLLNPIYYDKSQHISGRIQLNNGVSKKGRYSLLYKWTVLQFFIAKSWVVNNLEHPPSPIQYVV